MPVANGLPDNLRKTDNKSMKVGLHNFGSTCYMNSMLQILNSIGPFRNLLMQTKVEAPLVIEMKKLFSYLFYSERLDYAPKQMLDAFVPPINPGIQQDTTEFLNSLCDQLETALSGSPQKKLLDEIFKGAQAAQMICHSCGAKRENREEFFCFSVDIDGKYDLDAALEGSHQGEIISDFYCEMCQNRGETTKRNILT
jgi:ubiquitin C-terminal hydrolase